MNSHKIKVRNATLTKSISAKNKKVEQIAFITIMLSSLIFSCSLMLNLLAGAYAGYLRIIIIAIINIITLYCISKYKSVLTNKKILSLGFQIIFYMLALTLVSSAILGEAPIIAILYSSTTYLSFYCISYLFAILKNNQNFTKLIIIFLIILSLFVSIGIIYDATVGLTNTPVIGSKFAPVLTNISTVDGANERRGAFFLGSATSVFPFLSIGTLSTILFKQNYQKYKSSSVLIYCVGVIWLGYFFSYSRTPIVLGSAFSIYAIYKIICFSNERMTFPIFNSKNFLSSILIILFLGFSLANLNKLAHVAGEYQINRLYQIASVRDKGNSHRFSVWQKGLEQFADPKAWIGKGLGESNLRMKQKFHYKGQPQYESSILLTFAEGGIFGLISRLTPLAIVLYLAKFSPLKIGFYLWAFLMFCNLFASPLINGHSVQYAYFLGMSLIISFSTINRSSNTRRKKQSD